MASKGKIGSATGTIVGIGIALIVGYLLLKWLAAPKTALAAPGGFVGGGYGGVSASNPYAQSQSPRTSAMNLGSLLSSLLGKNNAAPASLGGSFAPNPAGQSLAALQQQIQSIAGYSTAANLTPLTELGGASLATYEPSYNLDAQFPLDSTSGLAYQTPQLYDVNQNSFSPPSVGDYLYGAGGGGGGDMSGLDTTSYDLGGIS